MPLWRSFWKSAAVWAGCTVALVTVRNLYLNYTGDYNHDPRFLLIFLAKIPNLAAWLSPLVVFAAGITAVSTAVMPAAGTRRRR